MSKKALWTQVIIFLAFISLFFVLNLIIPDRDFSQQENRSLQTAPKFSFSELFESKFTKKFEDYVTDQFAFRDEWISLKAGAELAAGKAENNGIFLCEGDRLLEGFTAPEQSDADFSLYAIRMLAENSEAELTFALIPSPAEIYSDLLPAGAPNDSQTDFIDYAYDYVAPAGTNTADIYSELMAHRDEYIFYRTDHHWTTLGAYYGYTALSEALGYEALPLESFSRKTVSEEFYGTTWSSSGFSWVEPDSIETFVEQGEAVITNYPKGAPTEGSLYVESFLEVKDKYSYFYGGNTPLLTIESGNDELPELLILRDSYMDSLSPFLMEHYSTIHIVDLRYYNTSLAAYMADKDIDQILVCYSAPNFAIDDNIFKCAY